jgi:hypothetical protein
MTRINLENFQIYDFFLCSTFPKADILLVSGLKKAPVVGNESGLVLLEIALK